MERVTDHAKFMEMSDLLEKAREKRAELVAERTALYSQLANPNIGRDEVVSRHEAVAALLDGKDVVESRQVVVTSASKRLVEVCTELERLDEYLRFLPVDVEAARTAAQRERIDELHSDFVRIEKKFESAAEALRDACRDEDELLQKIIAGGFGFHGPIKTKARWLRREDLLAQ